MIIYVCFDDDESPYDITKAFYTEEKASKFCDKIKRGILTPTYLECELEESSE